MYPTAEIFLDCLPRTAAAKNGLPVEMRLLPVDAAPRLIEMYLSYQPRNSFQGLPPIKDAVCVNWVREMLRTGIHVIALADRVSIVGHTALFPINQEKCEMLVVVYPAFQNVGIGTELVRTCIDVAYELGFQRIWLPVDATNVRARHVYKKCGFEYTSSKQGHELDMACDVARCRSRPKTAKRTCAAPCVPAPALDLDGPAILTESSRLCFSITPPA
jgi:RimJ/RimL family protein N-acetyltransferase